MERGKKAGLAAVAILVAAGVAVTVTADHDSDSTFPGGTLVNCVTPQTLPYQTITLDSVGTDELGAPQFGSKVGVAAPPYSTFEPDLVRENGEGDIYVFGNGCLWKSDDDGASFDPVNVNSPAGPVVSRFDSHAVVDADNALYYSDLGARISVGKRDDGASTWKLNTTATPNELRGDRQWMGVDSDYLYLVWKNREFDAFGEEISADTHTISVHRSPLAGNGLTGAPDFNMQKRNLTSVASSPTFRQTGKITVTDDVILVPFEPSYPTGFAVGVFRSTDQGATWSNSTVVQGLPYSTADSFIPSAVDSEGNEYIAWTNRSSTSAIAAYYAVREVGQSTWSSPVLVSSNVTHALFPSLIAGDDGRIGLVYYGANGTSGSTRYFPTSVEWHLYYTYTGDASAGSLTTVKVQSSPVHLGGICTEGCGTHNRTFGDYLGSIILDDTGRIGITYCDDYPATFQDEDTEAFQCPIKFIQQTNGFRLRESSSLLGMLLDQAPCGENVQIQCNKPLVSSERIRPQTRFMEAS